MHDMLRETPIYQEILKEGREEGLEQGLEQGLQRGQLEACARRSSMSWWSASRSWYD